MPHKTPHRPRPDSYDVSQQFNDGMVTVFQTAPDSPDGFFQEEAQTVEVKLPFQERRLGLKRFYEAKQNHVEVDRVLRVQAPPVSISTNDLCTVVPDVGITYRIDLVQRVFDVFPPCLDLTLAPLTVQNGSTFDSVSDQEEEVVK